MLLSVFTISALALGAAAITPPGSDNPECLATIWQRTRIYTADCRAAITQLEALHKSHPVSSACNKMLVNSDNIATVGTCKIVVEKDGDAQCADPLKVIEGIEKVLAGCPAQDGLMVDDGRYVFPGNEMAVLVVGSDEANKGDTKRMRRRGVSQPDRGRDYIEV